MAAIARTTASVNRPAVPDVPMRIVGLKLRTVSSSVMCAGIAAHVRRHLLDRPRVGRLEVLEVRPRLRHQSAAVHGADPRRAPRRGESPASRSADAKRLAMPCADAPAPASTMRWSRIA